MCGIIAGISDSVVEILISGLKQLQNRGYDSAGIALINEKGFLVNKKASNNEDNAINYLENHYKKRDCQPEHVLPIGIGHTRWATHGPKTDINSHPHISYDGKFALVHNGIIENYISLREKLERNGISSISETDSEIIVNLLAFYYSKNNDVEKSLEMTINELEGTWGLVIICLDYPNTLYCTRVGSPLLIGLNNNSALVTSEVSGFSGKISDYTILNNRDICVIHKDVESGQINMNTREKTYKKKKVNILANDLTPEPYKHWMLKEIFEQSDSVKRVIKQGSRILDGDKVHMGGLNENKAILAQIDHIILLGCGTSLNAAKFAIHYFKMLCGFSSVSFLDGADFGPNDISPLGNTALILLSQSGETKDLHRCIEIAEEHNLFTIGVVNVVDSLIAREVDCGCYLHAGREVAVASTKSFTSQCVLLVMIAVWFSQIQEPRIKKSVQRKHIIRDLRNLSTDIKKTLECYSDIKSLASLFTDASSCFLLGKGRSESMAHEGALKIKEISYIHAEGYSSSSLKHGPFALLHEEFPVILLAPDDEHLAKNMNAYEEVKSRHATIIRIFEGEKIQDSSSNTNDIYVPKNKTFAPLLQIIPIQLLSYKLAQLRNINPDMPRNLAKVVTVE
jgi:glucosamine--fructose-6-phosphate aminotransferase (isomerizing)